MSRRRGRYPIKKDGELEFRTRGGKEPQRPRQVTRRVVADYRSNLSKLSRGTLKSVGDDDSKSLRLLVMRFKYDLASVRVYPATKSSPDSMLLMLPGHADTRTRVNLRKAVEWRSWNHKPRAYVVHRRTREGIPLGSTKAPKSDDIGGILLQWGEPL